jgi:type IV pilus assembly protein PilY1
VLPTLFLDQFNGVRVQFGTGAYLHPLDSLDTTTQSFYGLVDDHSGIEITRDDLADQTKVSDIEDLEGKRGFVFDLPRTGERVVTEAVYFDGITFFTSFVPDRDICAAGGDFYLYFIDYASGAPLERPVIDVNQDHEINDEDYVEGTRSVRNGVYSGLASTPILSPGTNEIVIQSSDTRIRTRLFDFDIMNIISWRVRLE